MLSRGIVRCIVCLFVITATESSPAANHVKYNPRLKVSSRAGLVKQLRAPFEEGVAHPAGILNCVQFLVKDKEQSADSSTSLQEERSTMATCLMLQELKNAKPARISYVHDLTWDEHVLPLLPPQLAIAVSTESKNAADAAAAKKENWLAFDQSITAEVGSKGPEEIVVAGNGFSERLILWGRGDFTGDGNEDLLVQSLDTLTEGTYRSTRLFILTRHKGDVTLTVVRSVL